MSVAVITGAAGGLGRALLARLRAEGWQVAALDRDTPALAELAAEGVTLHPCDLTDSAAIARTCAAITAAHPAIDLVVHSAGVTHIGLFADSDVAAHRRVMEINHFAVVEITRHLLHPVRRARGVHLAISSVAGFAPLHMRTAYAASKHALEGFVKSLRSEEKPHGVACLIAAPSFVATNPGRAERQADGIARPGSAGDGFDEMTPEAAAEAILAGLRARRPMIPVGRVARLAWWANRLAPGFYQRQMERRIGADG
ncbi:SDR family NAD(P)-dependent oxidoreductase [Aquicoccus sp. SCR17]|nr:SDR family NAD(P)-dependent oxidoreductase [Carideicomes alvinocaridis]